MTEVCADTAPSTEMAAKGPAGLEIPSHASQEIAMIDTSYQLDTREDLLIAWSSFRKGVLVSLIGAAIGDHREKSCG